MKVEDAKDYRDFLRHLFVEKQIESKKNSYQFFATKVGVSKSYLKMVLEKKRHISLEKFFPIAQFFKIPDYEKQYLLFQILEQTVKEKNAKTFFSTILSRYPSRAQVKSTQTPTNDTSEIMQDWLKLAICNLVEFKNFQISSSWIQKALGGEQIAPKAQIESAIQFLTERNFLFQADGVWSVQKGDHPFTDLAPWDLDGFKRFIPNLRRTELALTQGGDAIHRPCRHHSFCFALSDENTKKVISLYDAFEADLKRILSEKQDVQRLLFISNNVFAISEEGLAHVE